MEPTGLEGLELVKRRTLIRHVEAIHAATATFARQRDLNLPEMDNADLPGFRASTLVRRRQDARRRPLGVRPRQTRGRSSPTCDFRAASDVSDEIPPPDPSQRSPID